MAVPCKDYSSEYAGIWLASFNTSYRLWSVQHNGNVRSSNAYDAGGDLFGVRIVVSLKARVNFIPSQNNINNTTTWNIEI